MSLSNEDSTVDYKVTKRHFPRTNNESCLEFIFEKDPNLYLRKNKILIKGAIEIDKGYIPENGFAAKLFSMMSVEIDSQTVSKNYNKYAIIYIPKLIPILGANFSLLTTSTRLETLIHQCLLQPCHMKDISITSTQIRLKYRKTIAPI